MSQERVSSWLGKFLASKRTNEVVPFVDWGPSNDAHIRNFFLSESTVVTSFSDQRNSNLVVSQLDAELDDDTVTTNDSDQVHCDIASNSKSFVEDHTSVSNEVTTALNSNDALVELDPVEAPTTSKFVIAIRNLPYKISEDEISSFAEKLGINFLSIKVARNLLTNEPEGWATAELSSEVEVTSSIQLLHSQPCGGRPVRVSRYQQKNRGSLNGGNDRRNSKGGDGSRYFFDDISIKCHNCGQVGHRMNDCSERPRPVCHLCAGRDHEAAACPNVTCFRCGDFGHHSRSCSSRHRNAKPLICTQCGSVRHDAVNCTSYRSMNPRDNDIISPDIRCMCCHGLGHAMCTELPRPPTNASGRSLIFCPNCGEEGHHYAFPSSTTSNSYDGPICWAPRVEAYMKIPTLGREMEQLKDCRQEERDRRYVQLLKGAYLMDQAEFLFPSLKRSSSTLMSGAGRHDRFDYDDDDYDDDDYYDNDDDNDDGDDNDGDAYYDDYSDNGGYDDRRNRNDNSYHNDNKRKRNSYDSAPTRYNSNHRHQQHQNQRQGYGSGYGYGEHNYSKYAEHSSSNPPSKRYGSQRNRDFRYPQEDRQRINYGHSDSYGYERRQHSADRGPSDRSSWGGNSHSNNHSHSNSHSNSSGSGGKKIRYH